MLVKWMTQLIVLSTKKKNCVFISRCTGNGVLSLVGVLVRVPVFASFLAKITPSVQGRLKKGEQSC